MSRKKREFKQSELTARERKDNRLNAERRAAEAEYARWHAKLPAAFFALILAVILLTTGILIPVIMNANYMFESNPVAVISLKAGDKRLTMKYEILLADCPIASTNFLFLASIGFFDGGVIYDTQNHWVRFGGYRAQLSSDSAVYGYTHRSDDQSFTMGQKHNFSEERYEDDDFSGIFRYSLRSDASRFDYKNFTFALCSNTSASRQAATEFQITGTINAASEISAGGNNYTFVPQMFGRPLNDDEGTQEAINYILSLEKSNYYIRSAFKTPVSPPIIVESVKAYNFEPLWQQSKFEHGFESYMTELNAFATDSWYRQYI